jgi:hypothetical protein
MVVHWARTHGGAAKWLRIATNPVGALVTAAALVGIVAAKFTEGAWAVVVVGPALVFGLRKIRRRYERVASEIERPMTFRPRPLQPLLAVVPLERWNAPAEQALRFASELSDEVIALHLSTEEDDHTRFAKLWSEKVEAPARAASVAPPRLEIIRSEYRRIYEPIIAFVRAKEEENAQRIVAVVIPELAGPRWHESLLHNLYGAGFKTELYQQAGARTAVVYVPWHLDPG